MSVLSCITLLCSFLLIGCSPSSDENHPPDTPGNPSPVNGATNQSINSILSWSASDPDGDALTYDVFFGLISDPPLVSSSQSAVSFNPDTLLYNSTYYWRIKARDSEGLETLGPLWHFTTITTGGNLPPYAPSYIAPTNNLSNAPVDLTFTWTCSDPNGDSLLFDFYLDTAATPLLYLSNLSGTTYPVSGLDANQTYYWALLAKDNHGNATPGPVWSFTTVPLSANQVASFGSLPKWSPDGQKLLFGGEGFNTGLWVYYPSTDNLVQILDATQPHLSDYAWSPTSDAIAFGGAGAVIDSTSGIFTINLDGTNLQRCYPTGHAPCWAPNGLGVVFAENDPQTGAVGIYKLTFAGGLISVLSNAGTDPQYHPNGTQIAYREAPGGTSSNFLLKVMSSTGANQLTLVDLCYRFAWAEGGSIIIYDYLGDNGMYIGRVPAVGGAYSILAQGAAEPSISNANIIAHQRINFDISLGVWTMTTIGTNPQQITTVGYQPSISPDGSIIAYARNDGIWLVDL